MTRVPIIDPIDKFMHKKREKTKNLNEGDRKILGGLDPLGPIGSAP